MPEKIYGEQIPFTDYAPKNLGDTIAMGLLLGFSAMQTDLYVTDVDMLDRFKAGILEDLATAIRGVGATPEYIQITWNEYEAPWDSGTVFEIRDLYVGFVVTTSPQATSAEAVLAALSMIPWYADIVKNAIPADAYMASVLNPCVVGYHWDAQSGTCVHDPCSVGYHWDSATQHCVIDTPTNCPVGTSWDEKLGRCVPIMPRTDGQGFPWVPVLVGIGLVSAIGLGGYYLYRRRKHRKPPPPSMQNPIY